MMKKLLTTVALFATLTASAQITLEHTYNEQSGSQTSWGVEGYHTYNVATGVWKIYTPSHQLTKTITVPQWNGAMSGQAPAYYGETIFNTDGEFEYMINYATSTGSCTRIIKENGQVIFEDENAAGYYGWVGAIGSDPKLLIRGNNELKVYSLGGTWPLGINEQGVKTSSFNIYPNPSSSMVSFEITEPSTIELINMQGQVVQSFPINDAGTVTVPVTGMVAGTYLVHVNGQFSERLVVR